jgi:hypothetical protein
MKLRKLLLIAITFIVIITSCSKDDDITSLNGGLTAESSMIASDNINNSSGKTFLTAPTVTAIVTGTTVVVSWEAIPNAVDGYHVVFGDIDSTANSIPSQKVTTTTTSVTISNLTGENYKVKVKALAENSNSSMYIDSPFSNASSFTVGSVPPVATPNLPMPNLGLAGNFGILSKSGITDVYKSTITGDVGTSPIAGTALLLACDEVVGSIYTVNDAGPACRVVNPSMLSTAVLDMEAAYTDLAGRSNPNFVELHSGNLGGKTLLPGLYKWSSTVNIPLDLTILGGANDVWIFQIAGTLDMASAKKVILSGGAQAKNIFWVVAGAVTLVTYSHFEGTILGKTSISLQTGGTVNGRLLAQTAVTLQMNTITQPL